MDAMTQNGDQEKGKSKVATLIKRLDAMYIRNGWKLPVWEDPEPNQHIILFRLPIKEEDWPELTIRKLRDSRTLIEKLIKNGYFDTERERIGKPIKSGYFDKKARRDLYKAWLGGEVFVGKTGAKSSQGNNSISRKEEGLT